MAEESLIERVKQVEDKLRKLSEQVGDALARIDALKRELQSRQRLQKDVSEPHAMETYLQGGQFRRVNG